MSVIGSLISLLLVELPLEELSLEVELSLEDELVLEDDSSLEWLEDGSTVQLTNAIRISGKINNFFFIFSYFRK